MSPVGLYYIEGTSGKGRGVPNDKHAVTNTRYILYIMEGHTTIKVLHEQKFKGRCGFVPTKTWIFSVLLLVAVLLDVLYMYSNGNLSSVVDARSGNTNQNDTVPPMIEDIAKRSSRIIYNRVPKCGSSAFITLMGMLASPIRNNFTVRHSNKFNQERMDKTSQIKLMNLVRKIPTPMIYEKHVHFLDFTISGMEQPAYINLVRDPLQRLVSAYYFHRYKHVKGMDLKDKVRTYDECVLYNMSECVNVKPEDRMVASRHGGYFHLIPYFCGQADFCWENSERALQVAIENVKRHYAVVGITEDYERFIAALERILPLYFRGALKLYAKNANNLKSRFRTNYRLPVTKEVERIMQPKLKLENEFYHFLKQRFEAQVEAIIQSGQDWPFKKQNRKRRKHRKSK